MLGVFSQPVAFKRSGPLHKGNGARRPVHASSRAANGRLARVSSPLSSRAQNRGLGFRHSPVVTFALPEKDGARTGPEIEPSVLIDRFLRVAKPFWTESEKKKEAWLMLAGVVVMSVGTTGISVGFNFLGRDFFNAISTKQEDEFWRLLATYFVAIFAALPVFVFREYQQSLLALRWREWTTKKYVGTYTSNRNFYRIQADGLVDNPDQRINSDIAAFTGTALGFALTLFSSLIDLFSFSGILLTIYPPLFGVLIVYAIGGTATSVYLGRSLVGLNFNQEAREADFRYALVRLRENAESVAFYGGEDGERRMLRDRFDSALSNLREILLTSRNLSFFTSGYRFLISFLPAAVVAPLFFKGEIEFGVINQSSSAFNHILGDVSLVVYQFEGLAGFAAVIDRLGQFDEVLTGVDTRNTTAAGALPENSTSSADGDAAAGVAVVMAAVAASRAMEQRISRGEPDAVGVLLQLDDVSLRIPNSEQELVRQLSLTVAAGEDTLIMGRSGAGKTSLLRAVAGLWETGEGAVKRIVGGPSSVFFVPQKPYLVLGSLRQQLLYPTWALGGGVSGDEGAGGESESGEGKKEEPWWNPNRWGMSSGAGTDSDAAGASVAAAAAGAAAGASASSDTGLTTLAAAGGASAHSAVGHSADPLPPVPTDAELVSALESVRLGHLVSRGGLDAELDWPSKLSLGEQQRLAFARVILSKPKLALLDESTSALDLDNEAQMYSLLKGVGTTVVSVGHRDSLAAFHSRLLRLGESAEPGWVLTPTAVAEKGQPAAKKEQEELKEPPPPPPKKKSFLLW